jgi:hypothetical protein
MQEHTSSLSVDETTSNTAAHETTTLRQNGHGHLLETAELNLGHWGDLLHSMLDHFATHFTCSRTERNFFRLRIPATLAHQQVFGIILEGGGKKAICSANMRDGLRDELFCTRLHSVLEISSLE